MAGRSIRWGGWGRWLAFLLGMLLILYGLPLVLVPDLQVQFLGGWNILLGLLIAGAVAANLRHAPWVAIGLALLLAVRLAIALVFLSWSVATLGDVLLFILGAVIAVDLRRQARSAS